MRWQQLFEDLRSQFDAQEAVAERVESASRARAEVGAVPLSDRLAGALGSPVVLTVRGTGPVRGVLVDLGPDWLLLEDDRARDHLVALAAITTVAGLGRRTVAGGPGGPVRARLDLRRALRGLARDRAVVQLALDDGGTLTGTVDRVGADHVELAGHPVDVPRRGDAVQAVWAVVLTAIAVVRTIPPGMD